MGVQTDWINGVSAVPGTVRPVEVDAAGTALVYRADGAAALRFRPPEDGAARAIDALEDRARAEGVRRVETQGKIAADSAAARALAARGYTTDGAPSVVFRLDVAAARAALAGLQTRLGVRAPAIESADTRPLDAVAAVVSDERLLDAFELQGRLDHRGAGAIRAEDSPVFYDRQGLGGFILIGATEDPAARELVVRWVSPRHRKTAIANLSLILDCLARAARDGVTRAYFSANADRHADTIALARSLGAVRCGKKLAFVRDLV